MQYKGCVDARKLILHYRRCRDIRARKNSGPVNSEPHFCLVCSLVARNAKSKSRSISPTTSTKKQLMPSANARCTPVGQPPKQQLFKQELRVRPRSFSFSEIGRTAAKPTVPRELIKTMPPPPPRFSGRQEDSNNDNNNMDIIQSTMSSALAVHRSEARDQAPNARPRAESLDLRKFSLSANDPQPTVGEDGFQVPFPPLVRRRSASFHVLSAVSPNGCQTIVEEPVGEELQELLEGDR